MYTSTVSKDFYSKQWKAETTIQLDQPNRRLNVSTYKSMKGVLYTSCQGVKIENNRESFMLYGDFSKTIKTFPALTRVNEKVITQAHNESLAVIENFINEANEFYAVKEDAAVVQ